MTNKTKFIVRQSFKLDKHFRDFQTAKFYFERISKTGGKATLIIKNCVANGNFYRKRIYQTV